MFKFHYQNTRKYDLKSSVTKKNHGNQTQKDLIFSSKSELP